MVFLRSAALFLLPHAPPTSEFAYRLSFPQDIEEGEAAPKAMVACGHDTTAFGCTGGR
jgi:hypothetical protein